MNTNRDQSLEADGVRVRFFWHGDRYAHEIAVRDGDTWRALLTSREGSPQDDWPASPPFQSLHIERRDGQSVALLVGMAGKSHWSASVHIDGDTARVEFDVAVRVRAGAAGLLGSCYRIVDGAHVPAIELAELSAPAVVESAGDDVRVAVAASDEPKARTIRWVYRVASAAKR